jgi:hypothetical protein
LIYSAVNDNWARVKIMHSVAREFLDETRGSEFRRYIIGGGDIFSFDAAAHDSMEKESQIVGMLMAWSVITLESLVNHTLAETINNKVSAVMAIEYSSQVTEKLKIGKSARSDLARKLIILSNTFEPDSEILQLCDELSGIRNTVVHDKPFDYIDFGDGNVEIDYYRSRGESDGQTLRYDALVSFFRKCDRVLDYILGKTNNSPFESGERSFSSLLNG